MQLLHERIPWKFLQQRQDHIYLTLLMLAQLLLMVEAFVKVYYHCKDPASLVVKMNSEFHLMIPWIFLWRRKDRTPLSLT
jgi:hypothetical protein